MPRNTIVNVPILKNVIKIKRERERENGARCILIHKMRKECIPVSITYL